MPIKYFKCKAGIVECSECLNACPVFDRCLTRPTLVKISQNRPFTGRFSTTQLLSGTREEMLKIKVDYAVEPESRLLMLLGTEFHEKLEEHASNSEIAEFSFKDEQITGIADLYDGETCTLYDYKTMGSYKAAQVIGINYHEVESGEYNKNGLPKMKKEFYIDENVADKKEITLQLNNYRMMFEKHGFVVKEMKIQILVRDGNTQIASSRGLDKLSYMVNIPILSNNEVTDYFTTKEKALKLALETGYSPKCNNEENWEGRKCQSYCNFQKECEEMGD